jgi:hypothetical protein
MALRAEAEPLCAEMGTSLAQAACECSALAGSAQEKPRRRRYHVAFMTDF